VARSSSAGIVTFNCAAMFQHGIVLIMIGPLVPEIVAHFGITEATVGMLLGVGSLGFVFGPLVAGTLADRYSVRVAFLVGTAVEVLCFLLLGRAAAFPAIVVAFFFLKFGASFVETGANVLPTVVPTKRTAHALMNFIHFFFSVGAFAGPLLIGAWLGVSDEWRPVLYAMIAPAVVIFVWATFLRIPRGAGGVGDVRRDGSVGENASITFVRAVANRETLFGAVALMCYVGAEVGLSAWLVYYLVQTLGLSATVASAGLSVLWFFAMVGRYGNSLLGNRFRSLTLVTVSGLGGAVSTVALLIAPSTGVAYVMLALIGLSLSGVFPNIMGELNGRRPEAAGKVTAVMSTGAAVGAALFQWLIGISAAAFGLRVALYIPALLQAVVVVAFRAALSGNRPDEPGGHRSQSDGRHDSDPDR
jgi:MFS transporter, FHS family, glucose/mannose:H+ symporter